MQSFHNYNFTLTFYIIVWICFLINFRTHFNVSAIILDFLFSQLKNWARKYRTKSMYELPNN